MRRLRVQSRLLGAAAALFLLCGRWTFAGLAGLDPPDAPFYYEVRFWAVSALLSGLLVTPLRVPGGTRGRVVLLLLLAFLGWAVLSSTWAPDAVLASEKAYDLALIAVGTLAIARILGAGAADAFAEGLWGGLLAFGSVLALIALASIRSGGGGERLAVLGGGPNVFGRMMGYLALAALFFWRRQGRMWLYLPISVLAVFLTLLSGSRGSFIGLAAGGLTFVFLELRRPGRLFFAVAAGAILFAVLVESTEMGRTAVDQFYIRMQVQLVEQRYTSGRDDIYRAAFELGESAPTFGAGLAAFPAFGLGAYAHNIFLEAFSETGLVGALLFLTACVSGVVSGLFRRPLPDGVVAGAFVLIFVASQFSGGFYDSRAVFVLLIAALRIPSVLERRSTRPSGVPRTAVVASAPFPAVRARDVRPALAPLPRPAARAPV